MSDISHAARPARRVAALCVSIAALVWSACASQGVRQAGQNPEQRLLERVRQYWDARIRDDIVAQYQFEEPWVRERVTLTAFTRGKGATRILEYEIKGVKVTDASAVAKLHLKYRILVSQLAHLPPREMDLDQEWVLIDGEWYLRYRPSVGPPAPRGAETK